MPSHSASDTVDDAPADSAVSVVGTGVWLGARPDAISIVDLLAASGVVCEVCASRDVAPVARCQGCKSTRLVAPAPAPHISEPRHRDPRIREHSLTTRHDSHCSAITPLWDLL
jgi:hypothetical protein